MEGSNGEEGGRRGGERVKVRGGQFTCSCIV